MSIVIFLSVSLLLIILAFSYFVFGDLTIIYLNMLITFLFVLYLNVRFTHYFKKLERRYLMFNFIELFVLNYDIQKSVEGTLVVVFPLLSPKALRSIVASKKEDGMMFLEGLRNYFTHNYYESFIDAITLVSERGGEILKVTEVLLFSISNSEAQMEKLTRVDNTYIIKFIFNWVFTTLIAVIFRFALEGTLNFDVLPAIYIIGNECFLAVFLISLFLVVENRIRRAMNVT